MHLDARLPAEVELGATARERFSIDIQLSDSGHEDRDGRWAYPLLDFEVAFPPSLRDSANYLAAIAAFRATGGGVHSFDFEHWADHEATDEPFGTGDGADTAFQLIKTYTFGGIDFERRIYRPADDIVIQADGVTVDPADYAIGNTGLITFDAPVGMADVLTWSGTFYVPVRFDLELSLTGMATHLEKINTFTLAEVRLRAEDFTVES